jgi:hypothetical protein
LSTLDEVRAELVRSRGFIRGAETQLSKALTALDGLSGTVPEPEPEPEPTPVTPPTGTVGPGPNDPGFPKITANAFEGTVVGVDGWNASAGIVIADYQGRKMAQVTYPAGKQDGTGAGKITYELPSHPRELYLTYEFARSSNAAPHPVLHKLGYMHGTGHPGGGDPVFWGLGPDHRLLFCFQSQPGFPAGPNRWYYANKANVALPTGPIHRFETKLIAGRGTGELHAWANDQKTHEFTGIDWGCTSWDAVNGDPIWGGNMGITVPETFYLYFDNAFVSGR